MVTFLEWVLQTKVPGGCCLFTSSWQDFTGESSGGPDPTHALGISDRCPVPKLAAHLALDALASPQSSQDLNSC